MRAPVFFGLGLLLATPAFAQEPDPAAEAPPDSFFVGDDSFTFPALDATPEQVVAHFTEQGAPPDLASALAAAFEEVQLEAGLTWQQGEVSLGDGLATLAVPEGSGWLGPEDAGVVLKAWGNPVFELPLGMLFVGGAGPFDDGSIGVVFDFVQDGYVDDSDAADIDYDDLLEELQDDTRSDNAERKAAGFQTVQLMGWADTPRYDSSRKQLVWAKELLFEGEADATLNYDVRALGRRGVMSMNAVGMMDQVAEVRQAMGQVTAGLHFNPGHAYSDFDPDLDEVAAYGIGALVAGKLAAKSGLLKGLLALLVAGKKFIVIGVIALFAFGKSLLGRGGGE